MKGKLREDAMKYVTFYWITSLLMHFKLSRNFVFFRHLSRPKQITHCYQIPCNVGC
jgi:hypothetical protein